MNRCLLPMLLLATLASAADAAGPRNALLLAGDADSLWLLRAGDGGFDIVAKPPDGDWKWIANDLVGTPTTAAATEGRLHLFQKQPFGYLLYNLDGSPMVGLNPADPNWPARTAPLALCRAGQFLASLPPPTRTADTATSAPPAPSAADLLKLQTVIAIVAPGPEEHAATSSLTDRFSAATTVPDGGNARRVDLSVFLNLSLEWRYLTRIPDVPLSRDTKILAACLDGNLYVSISGGGAGNRLLRWDQKRWTPIPLEPALADSQPLALMALGEQLVMLVGHNKDRSLRLGLAALTASKFQTVQPILLDGKPLVVSEDQHPLAAPFTGQNRIALVWRQGQDLNYATLGLNGEITNAQPLLIFSQPRPKEDGQRVLSYFLWATLIVILVPMFFFRAPAVPKPFELAPVTAPANLLRRGAAAMIDMVPFNLISLLYWKGPQFGDLGDQMQKLASQHLVDDPTYYALVTSLSLWVLYGTVMETMVGTTLGKKILRLQVLGDLGRKITFREALLRNATKIVEMTLIPPLLLVPLFSGYRQRVGDILARTVVIDANRLPAPPPPPQEDSDADE